MNGPAKRLYNRLLRSNFIAGASTPYTRKFIELYGLYDEEYKLLEDWPRYLNITRKGCSIGFINHILIKYRDGGITTLKENNPYEVIISNDYKTMWYKETNNHYRLI